MCVVTRYGKYGKYAIGVYAVYWTWREVVKHGPLRPYVYGEEEDHGHGHGHGGHEEHRQAAPGPV